MSIIMSSSRRKTKADQIVDLEQETQVLRSDNEEKGRQLKEAMEKTESQQKEILNLQADHDKLKKETNWDEPYDKVLLERTDLKGDKTKLEDQIKNNKADIDKLNETVKELNSDKKLLEEQHQTKIEELESKLSEKGNDNDEIVQEKDALIRKKDELEEEVELLKKNNAEFEDDLIKMREDFNHIKEAKSKMEEELNAAGSTQEEEVEKVKNTLHQTKVDLATTRKRADDLSLEKETMASENNGLFHTNEQKTKEIDELKAKLVEMDEQVHKERTALLNIKRKLEDEQRRRESTPTEFVLVSKSARSKTRSHYSKSRMESDDSEEEHIVSLVEASRAESHALREKEQSYVKRIRALETDKEDLFKSGSNLYSENRSLKVKYDTILPERETLLHNDQTQKRKIEGLEKEVTALKKTVHDLYQQNMVIKTTEEADQKRNAYVVVMGNELIKEMEVEKNALYRRVKYLEKENTEIEKRVMDLERQSKDLVEYSQKYDKHTKFPTIEPPRYEESMLSRRGSDQFSGSHHGSINSQGHPRSLPQVPYRSTPRQYQRGSSFNGTGVVPSPNMSPASRLSLPLVQSNAGRQSIQQYPSSPHIPGSTPHYHLTR